MTSTMQNLLKMGGSAHMKMEGGQDPEGPAGKTEGERITNSQSSEGGRRRRRKKGTKRHSHSHSQSQNQQGGKKYRKKTLRKRRSSRKH